MRLRLFILYSLVFFLIECKERPPVDQSEVLQKEFIDLALKGQELIMVCFQTQNAEFAYTQIQSYEQEIKSFSSKLSERDRGRVEVKLLEDAVSELKTAALLKMRFSHSTDWLNNLTTASENFYRVLGMPDSVIAKHHKQY